MLDDLVLASGSATRRRLLESAGVTFRVQSSGVDEEEVKRSLRARGADALDVAETLAEIKALQIGLREPDALVVGADQMLDCEGAWFDKPSGSVAVADHLRRLMARRYRLSTAAVVCSGGRRIWHHRAEAWLSMRSLSEAFVKDYVERFGEEVCSTVGAYRLEEAGAQLFSAIEGDYFVIQGLPLLPLLGFLRERGVLMQ